MAAKVISEYRKTTTPGVRATQVVTPIRDCNEPCALLSSIIYNIVSSSSISSQIIPAWLLISAKTMYFGHCSVYNLLLASVSHRGIL